MPVAECGSDAFRSSSIVYRVDVMIFTSAKKIIMDRSISFSVDVEVQKSKSCGKIFMK